MKVSAFNKQIQDTEEYEEAHKFYDVMLADLESVSGLLDDVWADGPGMTQLDLELDYDLFKSFLDKQGIGENAVFTSVFAYTLSRFAGSEKVFFNILENGRGRFNNLDAIGMFVNTLPILADCKNQDVSDFISYMSDLAYDVMKYNYYPFRLLASEYDIDISILFQYIPEWIGDEEEEEVHEDLESAYDSLVEGTEDIITDLNVEVIQQGHSYNIVIVYSGKYSRDRIERFVESYKLILSQLISVEKLSDIDYVLDSDLELLDSYNQTAHDLKYGDIFDGFVDSLSRYPDNTLVLSDDVSYTYAEGAYLIKQIQDLLIDAGIGVGDKVSVFVDRNQWVLLSNMGVLSVGATYVPLDENHPDERIKYMIEKSESRAVIVTDTFQRRVEELEEDIAVINVSSLACEGRLTSLDYVDSSANDVACILFTSGTTGNPKAVQVGRYSVTNMVSFYAHNSNFTTGDVYGVFASVGFDVSLQHYAALLCGGAVTWVPNDIKLNIKKLNEYFMKYGVTHTIITTQVSKLFVSTVKETSIKNLCAVGEKLGEVTPPEGYDYLDVYGPTEATSSMTAVRVCDKIDPTSVGGPDWNIKIYVLDAEQRRVSFGAVGELYISGYQVSKGYLNNVEANQKAFFDNPFDGDIAGYERMYKTGDVVRLLPDGTVGFIGRNDSQVKIRGNRVELSEIESVIRGIDYVSDITVQTVLHEGNYELVAYVVVDNDLDGESLAESIGSYVGERKPEYMIPSFIVKLDEIPLNVNGKVDKRALPEVDRDSLRAEYVAPSTETEKVIVEAFEEAFNQEQISLYDDFVRIGGDSLIAIKIMSILAEKDITVNVSVILNKKTPYEIAKVIDEGQDVYGFSLAKEGSTEQNMFILPPIGGVSSVFKTLIDNLDFNGNVYTINDFKFDLTIEEIRKTDTNMVLEKYYDAIKDVFQDGDILCGYSLGCIFACLLAERLESFKKVGKTILIDGTLDFVNVSDMSLEDVREAVGQILDKEAFESEGYSEDATYEEFYNKLCEVMFINDNFNFDTPTINSPAIYLGTSREFESKFNDIALNGEFILIDSDHDAIIREDVHKIVKYFK